MRKRILPIEEAPSWLVRELAKGLLTLRARNVRLTGRDIYGLALSLRGYRLPVAEVMSVAGQLAHMPTAELGKLANGSEPALRQTTLFS